MVLFCFSLPLENIHFAWHHFSPRHFLNSANSSVSTLWSDWNNLQKVTVCRGSFSLRMSFFIENWVHLSCGFTKVSLFIGQSQEMLQTASQVKPFKCKKLKRKEKAQIKRQQSQIDLGVAYLGWLVYSDPTHTEMNKGSHFLIEIIIFYDISLVLTNPVTMGSFK